MKPHPLTPIKSSNIRAVGYEPISKEMDVQFNSGGTYRYHGVPAEAHAAMVTAPSPGKFHSHNIKGKFKTTAFP